MFIGKAPLHNFSFSIFNPLIIERYSIFDRVQKKITGLKLYYNYLQNQSIESSQGNVQAILPTPWTSGLPGYA